ncbi:MAG: DUF6056 family protein [Faecalicatena sp.]|uniref:DUF6056 family protein n=1 Tax=Faecalicatena sp. TaxID=2005360 RepID=UPI002587FBE5|nr:DUF6056 family protein [Faecalicatena sp.]MCI6465768.1 DUF6056 family protein [Faecalicatena sp.]MDY5618818.1 DUF6056 family protein [Lachnospiraceae bacterium]
MEELKRTVKRAQDFCLRHSNTIEKAAVLLLCLGLGIFHYHVREYRADTLAFQENVKQYSLMGFLIWRANTWSGRVVLEGLLYVILKLPYLVFAILDSLMILGTVYGLRALFGWRRLETFVISLMLLCFPMDGLIEVGIQPGAINYIWALAAAVIALIPLGMIYREKPIRWYHYIGFGAAAIVGCNMEQTAAVVFCFYFIALLYFLKNKRQKPILFVQMFLSMFSLVFIMTCKGNSARLIQETASYWKDFGELSAAKKLWNGWFTTVSYFFSSRELPFFMFITVLCIWLWIKYRKVNLFTICGTIPLFVRLGIWAGKFPDILFGTRIRDRAAGVWYENGIPEAPPHPLYPQIILYTILILMIGVAICGSFQSIEETVLVLLILSAGFATRILMGFSPTLIASGTRTFFFLDVSLYIGAVWYIRRILRPQL